MTVPTPNAVTKISLLIKVCLLVVIGIVVAVLASRIGVPNSLSLDPQLQFTQISMCFPLSATSQQQCLDEFIAKYATQTNKTTKQILADLELAETQDQAVNMSCHVVSHAIGRFTYAKSSNVGEAFTACGQTCNSGCYHGVLERVFFPDLQEHRDDLHLSYEELSAKVPYICNTSRLNSQDPFLMFQCLHGLGHAVNYFSNYNLEQALNLCDLLSSDYERDSCYGGVFMENVTGFEKGKRDINPQDPHYPCNKVATKYQSSCYTMQTSLMFEYGYSNQKAAEACSNAVNNNQSACFYSYGRDLSNLVRNNRTLDLVNACENFATGFEQVCIVTAVNVLIDAVGDGKYAYRLCDALTRADLREPCYRNSSIYFEGYFKPGGGLADCQKYSVFPDKCMQYVAPI